MKADPNEAVRASCGNTPLRPDSTLGMTVAPDSDEPEQGNASIAVGVLTRIDAPGRPYADVRKAQY